MCQIVKNLLKTSHEKKMKINQFFFHSLVIKINL